MSNGTDLTTNRITPIVDFTSADFQSINDDLTTYAQATFSDRWTDFNADQFAVVFKELVAYLGDLTSYQMNSGFRELFAATAVRRQNLANIGKAFDYVIQGAFPATVALTLTLDPAGIYPTTIDRTDQYANGASGDSQVIFHPTTDVVVPSYPVGGLLVIDATEGTFYENILIGVSNGSPSQRWQFPQQGVISSSIAIVVGSQTWTATTNFTLNSSTATVFKIVQTDDGYTYAFFGDGIFGAIPTSTSQITATFNVGGGIRGNVSQNTIKTKVSANPVILSLNNPFGATGGSDPQSMYSARNGIPASLSTLERGVTDQDYANLAILVPGVAKARSGPGLPSGSRSIRIWIAPSGGGFPTNQLLTSVAISFIATRMVTNRVQLRPVTYKTVLLNVLLHVNNSFRASDVNQITRDGIINLNGTGILDFDQLDFEGIIKDSSGDDTYLLTQTGLQAYFRSLLVSGLDRAEIQQLSILPEFSVPDTGNTGNGNVTQITTTSRQRRRQYFVLLLSATQYSVYERIVGYVGALTDNVLTDTDKTFENEGIASFAGYTLIPNSDVDTAFFPVTSASGTDITIFTTGGSLFTFTAPDQQYFLYNPVPTLVNVGSKFTSTDGNVSFTVNTGLTNFIAGDSFIVDIYPIISDIRLGKHEYPQLIAANLVTRTSGGSNV